jgi:trehalose-phosphatase
VNVSRPLLPELPTLCARLRNCDHVLLGLDFDGTLAPIVAHPDDAKLPAGTAAILRSLAESEHVSVAILSGRPIADLESRINLDVICCGNHGLEIEGRGISFVHRGAAQLRSWIDLACWDLEAAFQGVRGVVIERKGLTATVHHRHAPACLDVWIEVTIRLVLQPYASYVALRSAIESWEIRPRVDWNKGCALGLLMDRIAAERPLLVCAGDDSTDEDMFRVSPDSISIQVGGCLPTQARYRVSGPAELEQFLEFLCAAWGSDHPRRGGPLQDKASVSEERPILR